MHTGSQSGLRRETLSTEHSDLVCLITICDILPTTHMKEGVLNE